MSPRSPLCISKNHTSSNQTRVRAKAYALLREALAKTGKVGIAQFVLRNRESLCVLKPQGQGLVLNALRFVSEIRSMEELALPSQ